MKKSLATLLALFGDPMIRRVCKLSGYKNKILGQVGQCYVFWLFSVSNFFFWW